MISTASPNSSFIIHTNILPNTDKSFLQSVYICPSETTFILPHALPILALDCAILKGEAEGVLYYALTFDGNNHVIPLAFMLAEEESTAGWTSFVDHLENDQIMPGNDEYSVIRQLCHTLDQLMNELSSISPNIASSTILQSVWNPFGSVRRQKSKGNPLFSAFRALLHRVVFCRSSLFSSYVNQLVERDELVWDYLKTACCYRHGHDHNHDYLHDHINMCIQQFEKYYLQKGFLYNLMIDDVISGLYEMIASESDRRRSEFSKYNPAQLTPTYQQLEAEYCNVIPSYLIISTLPSYPSTHLSDTSPISTTTTTIISPPPPTSTTTTTTTTTTTSTSTSTSDIISSL